MIFSYKFLARFSSMHSLGFLEAGCRMENAMRSAKTIEQDVLPLDLCSTLR